MQRKEADLFFLPFSVPARLRAKADCELACLQLTQYIQEELPKADTRHFKARAQVVEDAHNAFMKEAEEEEARTSPSGMPTVPSVLGELRKIMPKDTTVMSEAISNYRKSRCLAVWKLGLH